MIITNSKNLNLLGTHLFYTFIFIVLSIFYFKPAVFEKKELKQHDIFEHRGGAKELADYRGQTGTEALWTNSMFSGMPSYLISTLYPGELVKNWASTFWSFFPPYTLLLLVSLFSFYILMLAFNAKPLIAAIGAIGFAFSSFTIISIFAGHNTKVVAMGYMPLVLAGVVWLMKEKYLLGFIITAIGFALNIGANHYQITYYLLLLIGVLFIIDLIQSLKEKKIIPFFKKAAVFVIALGIGICSNIASISTTLEYSPYSMRGGSELTSSSADNQTATNQKGLEKEYAFNWSLGKFETLSLLIPNIQGGASVGSLSKNSAFYKTIIDQGYPPAQAEQAIQRLPIYWGDQPFTAGPVYFGAIICFLFVVGLFIIDKKIKYWLLLGTIFSIVLAWGKNFDFFNTLIFDFLPGYNKFRAVTMILIVGQLCMCIGAALAIQKITELNYTKGLIKKIGIATGITAGLCLLIYISSSMLRYETAYDLQMFKDATQYLDALKKDRADLLRKDSLRSLFFILASAGLIFFLLKKKINKNIAFVGLLLFVIVDLWMIDKRYLNEEKFEKKAIEKHFTITPADEFILKDPALYYRVANVRNPFGEARTSYYHKSIGGYHGAKIRRYADLIDYYLSPELDSLEVKAKKGSMNNLKTPVLNMLNTTYFIFDDSPNGVFKNEQTNGNAWFVEKVETTHSPNEEIEKLRTIDTKTTAVIDQEKFKLSSYSFEKDPSASIKLEKYEPNHLIYKSTNSKNGLAVFSEVYYPKGWKASIDGKEVPISRVNYILRAIEIPAGNHQIEFKFEPASYKIGNKIALVSSLLLVGLSLVGITFQVINRRKKKNLLI